MATDPPVEVELKYRVASAGAGKRFLKADLLGPFIPDGESRTSDSQDRYVDTPDGAIAAAGYAARLRRVGADTIISLKSLAVATGSLQRRTELEGPSDAALPPDQWPDSPARSLLLKLCGTRPLEELVTVHQVRRKRRFRSAGTVVELSLDQVEVISRSVRVGRFTEVEVELMEGPEAPLLQLRTIMDADPDLVPSSASKLESALAAATLASADAPAPGSPEGEHPSQPGGSSRRRGRKPPSTPAEPDAVVSAEAAWAAEAAAVTAGIVAGLTVGRTPGVTPDDVVAEAGRKVLRFHLARLIAREAGTRLGEDAEELHAMRVATRRMRAAWRVFGDGFRPEGTRRFRNRLRDVAQKLGSVRDIDVLILALEEYRAPLPAVEGQALEPLFDDWRAQRDDARVILARELDSNGYRRFVEDYRAFVLTPGAGALVVAPTEPHHVRDTAGSRIWHAYEAVLAYGPLLRWADVPTLHQLRIAGKWLRYTLEFVAEGLGPDAKPLIERVVAMQDHLGLMNDAEVAAMKARALLVARTGTLSNAQSAAIAHYLTSREAEVTRLKRGAAASWRSLASPMFRRGLGRAVATIAASPSATAGH